MAKVNRAEELVSHLWRGLEIEVGFESLSQTEATHALRTDEFRQLVVELAGESKEHKRLVESLISMVKTQSRVRGVEQRQHVFDFSGMTDTAIVDEIAAVEELAKDLYTRIRDLARASDLKKFVDEKDIPRFMSTLEHLINDELSHEGKVLTFGMELRKRKRESS